MPEQAPRACRHYGPARFELLRNEIGSSLAPLLAVEVLEVYYYVSITNRYSLEPEYQTDLGSHSLG